MELKDLIHKRTLRGVSFGVQQDARFDDAASSVTFILGRTIYTALEDANDGYRSSLKELIVGGRCTNVFPLICHVRCQYITGEFADLPNENRLLVVTDIFTDEPVLLVGTNWPDDYYPRFISRFMPENMAANRARR